MEINPEQSNANEWKKKVKLNKKFFITIGAIVFALVGIMGMLVMTVPKDTVANGVYLENMPLGGLTEDEVLKLINANEFYRDCAISIEYGRNTESFTNDDIDLQVDAEKTARKAFEIGKSSNAFTNAINCLKLKFSKLDLYAEPKVNTEKLDTIIYNFGLNVNGVLKEHEISYENDTVTIISGKSGQSTNVEKARNDVLEAMGNDIFENIRVDLHKDEPKDFDGETLYNSIYREPQDASYKTDGRTIEIIPHVVGVKVDKTETQKKASSVKEGSSPVTIKFEKVMPDVTTDSLKAKMFTGTLYSFSTKYNASKTNRAANVALAASKMDGYILAPGDIFSYNDVVGKRTAKNGFKNAPVYENGKSVDGIGGGVCQVSTTLYSAVLFADLEIVSRTNHSLPVSYVPLGQDATVVDGAIDFKFKNNTNYPVKVAASAKGGVLTIALLGTEPESPKTVKLDHKTISTVAPTRKETNDPSLPAGTEKITYKGQTGYTVTSTKTVTQNGKSETQSLGKSVYKMVPIEVSIGTGTAAQTATVPKDIPKATSSPNPKATISPEPKITPSPSPTSTPKAIELDKPTIEPLVSEE